MRTRIFTSAALAALLGGSLAGCAKTYNPNMPSTPIPAGEGARVEQESKQGTAVTDSGGTSDGGAGSSTR